MMFANVITTIEADPIQRPQLHLIKVRQENLATFYSDTTREFCEYLKEFEGEHGCPRDMSVEDWSVFIENHATQDDHKNLIVCAVFFLNAREALEKHIAGSGCKFEMLVRSTAKGVSSGLLHMDEQQKVMRFSKLSPETRKILRLFLCTSVMARCIEVVTK